jgi:hypothetical protein
MHSKRSQERAGTSLLHGGRYTPTLNRQPTPTILIINVKSPITVNMCSPKSEDCITRITNILEHTSVRIAVLVISVATTLGIVAHKLGLVSWSFK